jgi:hypothetical protein
MTRRFFALLSLAAALAGPLAPQTARLRTAAQPARPKLVIGIVVDQFRYDYSTRFRADYTGGIARLLTQGAVFTNARYQHFPTVTGVGHAVIMTGAPPVTSGIVDNSWYDRDSGKNVYCVEDSDTRLLGGKGTGFSPRRLAASTLGDEMKMAWRGKPRVIGISLKDRAAILLAGHMADGAYWFDTQTGSFVSSTFYFDALPQWVVEFNASHPADRYLGAEWKPLVPNPDFPAFSKIFNGPAGPKFYGSLDSSPYGNELVEAFAERAIAGEQLGTHGVTDLLTVSFSANDYVGHAAGPDAPEVRDMAIRVDRLIGKLLDYANQKVGAGNVLVFFTADHGVAPMPELMAKYKMPNGRYSGRPLRDAVQRALADKYGEAKWVLSESSGNITLNREPIVEKKLNEAEVERTAAAAVERLPHIYRVYTREQLLAGIPASDPVSRCVVNGFYPSRSADVIAVGDAFAPESSGGTSHGSPWGYDLHVPLIFLGPGIKPGRYDEAATPYDIASTLATMLNVETPSGSIGRVLTEVLVKQ